MPESVDSSDRRSRGEGRMRMTERPKAGSARRPTTGSPRNTRQDKPAGPILAPRRRRNHKPPDRRPLFWTIACLLVFAALVAWSLVDPRLDVRRVAVRGAQTFSADEIAAIVPVPAHRNIFLYSLTHRKILARRIEQAEPAVETAGIGIRLPDALVVNITERQPYALIREGDGQFWMLDNRGVPFRQLESRPVGLPCATLPANSLDLRLGQPLSLDSATPVGTFFLALSMLSGQRMAILSKIREFTVDQNANLCLNMSNNLQIRLGQPDELAQKLTLAATALSSDTSLLQRAQYLDFTDPQRPAWKPRNPAVPEAPLPRDSD